MDQIPRKLHPPDRSFFLFGPRGVGKGTWLKNRLPDALYIDLLKSSTFLELSSSPDHLEALVAPVQNNSWVIIDEIQKLPELLDEVHRLLELKKCRFALCGSSARKLRRAGVNLLGGRAVTRNLEQFSGDELGSRFDFTRSLEWGMLPYVQTETGSPAEILDSYVNTYIREEIKEEGFVRRVQSFARFLSIAGRLNGRVLNLGNVSRDAGVPRSTVDVYFSILEETLLSHFLPAYRPGLKVRETAHPKFYWFDPGVARAAAGWLFEPVDRMWLGLALETLVYHELRVFSEVNGLHKGLFYYNTPNDMEIDFVVETNRRQQDRKARVVCFEVKLSEKWERAWERPMRSIASSDIVTVDKMMGVYTGTNEYEFDGVRVLPYGKFVTELHAGNLF
jgi:predicted AAA+ superfamily ATPase